VNHKEERTEEAEGYLKMEIFTDYPYSPSVGHLGSFKVGISRRFGMLPF
jgi:hypothetical protein